MACNNRVLKVDTNKLRAFIEERGMTVAAAGRAAGYTSQSSMHSVLQTGSIGKAHLELFCLRYGIEPKELMPDMPKEVKQEAVHAIDNSGIEAQLTRIADALEAIATNPQTLEGPVLTNIERCVLLLKQMTCYGGCQKADFTQKALENGMSAEVQDMAIRMTKLKAVTKNGVDWLSKT